MVVSVYIYCDSEDIVFQMEREECNIPISIGGLLSAWLLVKWLVCLLHSQKIAGSRLTPPALLCEIYYNEIYSLL